MARTWRSRSAGVFGGVLLWTLVACGGGSDPGPPAEYRTVPDLCGHLDLETYDDLADERMVLTPIDSDGQDAANQEDDTHCSYTDVVQVDYLDLGLTVILRVLAGPEATADRYQQLISEQQEGSETTAEEGPWDEAITYVNRDEAIGSLRVGWYVRHGNAVVWADYHQQAPRTSIPSQVWRPAHPPDRLLPLLRETALAALDACRITNTAG
jgi:hypothetical protein